MPRPIEIKLLPWAWKKLILKPSLLQLLHTKLVNGRCGVESWKSQGSSGGGLSQHWSIMSIVCGKPSNIILRENVVGAYGGVRGNEQKYFLWKMQC